MDKEAECNANANDDLKEGINEKAEESSNLCGRKKFLGLILLSWPHDLLALILLTNFRLKKKNSVEGCIKNPAQKKIFLTIHFSLCFKIFTIGE